MSKRTSDSLTGGTMCFGHSGLVAVAAASTLTNVAVPISLNGRCFTAPAATATASPTLDGYTNKAFLPLAANQACIFVVTYDKVGTRRVIQGPLANEADYASGGGSIEFPSVIPEDQCPIGYILAQANKTAVGNWTFGTNNFSGVTGVTTTAQAANWLPSGPLLITN